jgi:hypothetical protein
VKRGAYTSSVVKVVAADGDPVNVTAPILVWTADPIVMYESCMTATLAACDAAKAWFAEPPTERAMLPHASAALFYRCVLFNDVITRLDNKVYCDVCTEVGVRVHGELLVVCLPIRSLPADLRNSSLR